MQRRIELGYSAEMVSRIMDISQYYYFQLENGQRGKHLTVKVLLDLVKALDMEPIKLLNSEADYITDLNNINKKY
jgi:transcriptional regulator with XRE-family HTH domain